MNKKYQEYDDPRKWLERARLTRFAVASRYPGPTEPITDEEYQKALDIAEHVVKWARVIIE